MVTHSTAAASRAKRVLFIKDGILGFVAKFSKKSILV